MTTCSSSRLKGRRDRGLSLIELVVVVFLIGTLALLAAPSLHQTFVEMEVERAAVEIEAFMHYARSLSVKGAPHEVVFSIPLNRIVVRDESEVNAPHPTKKSQDCILYLGTRRSFEHVDLMSADFGGDDTVFFDRLGNADTGGTVVVAAGDFVRTVRVLAPGGKTSIE
jgi:prepilin-type N-terminal cleavage/methylation domain-containing protein